MSGTMLTSTRCAGNAGPRWSVRSSGASTSATSTPTWARSRSGPSSSTSTSGWRPSSGLPLRLSGAATEAQIGFPFRRLADEEGVLYPDDFIYVPGVGSRTILLDAIERLKPGVTEAYLHPAVDSPELRAMAVDWSARVDDHALLARERPATDAIERNGVTLIGYRPIRDLMRSGG